jgi:hypothetical protein
MYCSTPVIMDHTFHEPPVICSVCCCESANTLTILQHESECNIPLLCRLFKTSPYTSTNWQCICPVNTFLAFTNLITACTSSLAHCYSKADMFTWLVPPVYGRQQTTQCAVLPTMIMNSPDTILSVQIYLWNYMPCKLIFLFTLTVSYI